MSYQIKEMILTHKAGISENGAENEDNCNTDVVVEVEEEGDDGKSRLEKYMASFFTYKNIAALANEHKRTGAFLGGAYFHANNMVLVERCTEENIRLVVEDLIQEGEFGMVFHRL